MEQYWIIALRGLRKCSGYEKEKCARFFFDTVFSYQVGMQLKDHSEAQKKEIKTRVAQKFEKQMGPEKNPTAVLTTLCKDELKDLPSPDGGSSGFEDGKEAAEAVKKYLDSL